MPLSPKHTPPTVVYIIACKRHMPRFLIMGLLVHHLTCALGMASCIIYDADGAIVIFGAMLGELSNPPRLIALVYEEKSLQRRRWIHAHHVIFVITRLIAAKYTEAVVPFMSLTTTFLTSLTLLMLSVMVIVYQWTRTPTVHIEDLHAA